MLVYRIVNLNQLILSLLFISHPPLQPSFKKKSVR